MINSLKNWFTSPTSARGPSGMDGKADPAGMDPAKPVVSAGTSDGHKPPASKGVSLGDAIKAIGTFYLFQSAGASPAPTASHTDAMLPTPAPRQWSAGDFVRELASHGEVTQIITSGIRGKGWWEEYAREFSPQSDPCGAAREVLVGLAQSPDTGREISLYDYNTVQDVPQAFNQSHEMFGSTCDGYASLLERLPHLVTYSLAGPETLPPLLPPGASQPSSPALYLGQRKYAELSLTDLADSLVHRGHIVWSLPLDGRGSLIAAMPGTREAFKVVDRLQQTGAFTPHNPLPPRPEPEPVPTDTKSAEPFGLEDLASYVIVGTTVFLASRAMVAEPAPVEEIPEDAPEDPPQEPAGAAQAGPQGGPQGGAGVPGDVELVPLMASDSPEPPVAPHDHDRAQDVV